MALVRVYCGIASTAPAVEDDTLAAVNRLTVAVVDDSGRLLEFCVINDDPSGYAQVTSMLAERFGGSTMVTVAVDSDDHQVISLLATSGRAIAYTDDESADEFADRFADDDSLDEVNASADERRAVGLARALQAGALSAVVGPPPREFVAFKPVLAAHAALAVGRHAAAVALREVLRELYPAALRAYPDPAEPVALAVLEALPEPGLLATQPGGRSRENGTTAESVAARLVSDGVCDSTTALEAVMALRVAIAETPRRNGVGKQLLAAVADAVRSSVAAVRASDAARAALIETLTERSVPVAPQQQTLGRRSGVPVTSAPPATAAAATGARRRTQPMPVNPTPATPRPMQAPPVAPMPVAAAPSAPAPVERPSWSPSTPPVERPSWSPSTPPVPPGFEPTPLTGTPMVTPVAAQPPVQAPPPAPPQRQIPTPIPSQRASRTPADNGKPFVPTLTNAAISNERAARGFNPPPQPSATDVPIDVTGFEPSYGDYADGYGDDPLGMSPPARPAVPPRQAAPPPPAAPAGSRANWPLNSEQDEVARPADRVTPPWLDDDLVLPEAPSLRLVDPTPRRGARDEDAPPLRLVDDSALTGARLPKPQRSERASSPASGEDDDLLIFASVSSAWFNGPSADDEPTWNSAADNGWRAAEQAARPSVGNDTTAGLPRRVPSANLVPGSTPEREERPLRIVRDAAGIAAHTSNYFRGWRRGNQEIGGFAVGGRPGRESANGWDFSREHERDDRDDRDDREYGYRAANYR
ncbi:transposase [Catellatospora tritici]|uniref:transposase n=1 Tax=Catellatospora tritici TaxID=2851566 RepID=UPI0027DEC4F2|nr:transposase [Catellatospora tritici]